MDKSHQTLGRELELFFFDDISSGSCFFLPAGQYIYNKLIELVRKKYDEYEYSEVSTPILCEAELWKTSGHYDKYKENMFFLEKEKDSPHEMGVCPMNCPKHILIYKHMHPSFRNLPIRLADFGALHRNEPSGALTGLTRVRLFHQDDAHIFCMPNQIENEINNVMKMMMEIYKIFDFKYEIAISTRPEKYIGEIEYWNNAEKILKNAVSKFGSYLLKEGDGAFYGPKIDIMVADSLGRKHQLGTIQLDFNLPMRFGITYVASDGTDAIPVMIHRAIFGSLERFIAILIEDKQGRLPLWINPKKIAIIPVNNKFTDKCNEVKLDLVKIFDSKVGIDVFDKETVAKCVLISETLKYNYILVIGKKESTTGIFTVRYQNDKHETVTEEIKYDDFIELVKKLKFCLF